MSQTPCYDNGGIRCGCGGEGRPSWETLGYCNQVPTDWTEWNRWQAELKRLQEELSKE